MGATLLAMVTAGAGTASAYKCTWFEPSPYDKHHNTYHQGGPDRGPHCYNGAGSHRGKPFELQGHGHRAGFIMENGSPCETVRYWAEPHHRDIHGVRFTFYYVWATGPGYDARPTILACEDHRQHVDPLTIGPGPHGASLPCPEIDHRERQTRPLSNGIVWEFDGYGDRPLSHVQGGFGHGNDGYWHYKLHNWWLTNRGDPIHVRLQGFCDYWRD